MISHIVLFEPKDGLDESRFILFAQQLNVVLSTVPGIKSARIGRSVQIDTGYGRNLGDNTYSLSAVLEFEDTTALIAYLNHAEHHRLGKLFWECCGSTVVMEAETMDGLAGDVTELLVKKQN